MIRFDGDFVAEQEGWKQEDEAAMYLSPPNANVCTCRTRLAWIPSTSFDEQRYAYREHYFILKFPSYDVWGKKYKMIYGYYISCCGKKFILKLQNKVRNIFQFY